MVVAPMVSREDQPKCIGAIGEQAGVEIKVTHEQTQTLERYVADLGTIDVDIGGVVRGDQVVAGAAESHRQGGTIDISAQIRQIKVERTVVLVAEGIFTSAAPRLTSLEEKPVPAVGSIPRKGEIALVDQLLFVVAGMPEAGGCGAGDVPVYRIQGQAGILAGHKPVDVLSRPLRQQRLGIKEEIVAAVEAVVAAIHHEDGYFLVGVEDLKRICVDPGGIKSGRGQGCISDLIDAGLGGNDFVFVRRRHGRPRRMRRHAAKDESRKQGQTAELEKTTHKWGDVKVEVEVEVRERGQGRGGILVSHVSRITHHVSRSVVPLTAAARE